MARGRSGGAHGIHHRSSLGLQRSSAERHSFSDGRSRARPSLFFHADPTARFSGPSRNEATRRVDGSRFQQTRFVPRHIHHPRMTAEEWTEAYENAWETFYSRENMIKILSRWSDDAKNYWNL